MSMARVLVIGDVNVDVIAATSGPIRHGSDSAADIHLVGGGSAANIASWLAWHDTPVTLVGCVGADSVGNDAIAELTSRGVTSHIRQIPQASTGMCIVIVDPSGERSMLPDAGANESLRSADVSQESLEDASVVLVTAYPLLRNSTRGQILDILRRCHARNIPTVIDAASAGPIADAGAQTVRELLAGNHVVLNADEACALMGSTDPVDAARHLSHTCASVILKQGSEPAVVFVDAAAVASATPPRCTVIDTTGAGDAFAAGYLTGWVQGRDLNGRLDLAVAAGAHAVTRRGARPA